MDSKLLMTVEQMQDEGAWLKVRNGGIGGSDVSVIMGMNPWKDPYTLWLEKTGQREPEDLSNNQRVYWGKKNEQNIAEWFMEVTGKKVTRCGIMQNNQRPYMLASVDRLVKGEKAGLEIKTAGVSQAKLWAEDNMPDAYYLQVQHYMAVTGLEKWYVAVLIGGNEARWMEVPRNEQQIEEIRKKCEWFWDLVTEMVPPPVDGSDSCADSLRDLYPNSNGAEIDLTGDSRLQHSINNIIQLKDNIERLERMRKRGENSVKAAMQEYETAKIGPYYVSWKNQAPRSTVDTKKLKENFPDVYEQVLKVGKPVRVFRIKGGEDDD